MGNYLSVLPSIILRFIGCSWISLPAVTGTCGNICEGLTDKILKQRGADSFKIKQTFGNKVIDLDDQYNFCDLLLVIMLVILLVL